MSAARTICIGAALRKSCQRRAGVPGLPIATNRFCRAYSSFSGCLPSNFRMRPCPTPARMMTGCTLSRRESFTLAWRKVYVQDSMCSQAPLTAHTLASKAERSISGMDTSRLSTCHKLNTTPYSPAARGFIDDVSIPHSLCVHRIVLAPGTLRSSLICWPPRE